jgi:membrane-associated phospholipid phosphatase
MTSDVVRHRRLYLVLMIAGVAVVLAGVLLARQGVYQWEIVVLSAINDLPGNVSRLLWILNQYGTVVTIPIATVVALAFRKWTLAVALAVTGVGVYLLAKVIKEFVERGRPAPLIEGVVEREAFAPGSLGYPSGHAAVACAITLLIAPYVRRGWQIAALGLAIVVPFVRMYVGAHLPLDLIGGAALGVATASAANFLLGVPLRRASDERSG